ncbi:MAG: hypothetical protein R3C62_17160 [Chloroflexota bacterium]
MIWVVGEKRPLIPPTSHITSRGVQPALLPVSPSGHDICLPSNSILSLIPV